MTHNIQKVDNFLPSTSQRNKRGDITFLNPGICVSLLRLQWSLYTFLYNINKFYFAKDNQFIHFKNSLTAHYCYVNDIKSPYTHQNNINTMMQLQSTLICANNVTFE